MYIYERYDDLVNSDSVSSLILVRGILDIFTITKTSKIH